MKIAAPKPGKYPNTPFDLYALWDARNHSQLRLIERSPLHFQQSVLEDSPAKIVGRAAHLCLLEPHAFAEQVMLAPVNPKTGKSYGYDTLMYAGAAAECPGSILLSEEDMEACMAMRKAVWAHPGARDILAEQAVSELSCVWKDGASGILCKMRGDRVSGRWWVDFKTTEDASPVAFARSVVDYGYDTAQAFYDLGRKAHGITATPVLIVAEKKPPYAVAVYEIGEQTMGTARTRVNEWMARLERCLREKAWPGYDEAITTIEAPVWHLKKFADAEV